MLLTFLGKRVRVTSSLWNGNPLSLPAANRQAPIFGTGDLALRNLALGGIAVDPHTGVKVQRITDSSLSAFGFIFEYTSGPPISSHPWQSGSDWYVTVAYHQNSGGTTFCDIKISDQSFAISNRRAAPASIGSILLGFSRNPNTPRICYYLGGTRQSVITRYDTNSMAAAPSGNFPKDLTAVTSDSFHGWFHFDDNDRWFIFAGNTSDYVVAWDSLNNTSIKKTLAQAQAVIPAIVSLDEPHIQRNGAGAVLLYNSAKPMFWDFASDVITDESVEYLAHPDSVKDTFVSFNGSAEFRKGKYNPDSHSTIYTTITNSDGDKHASAVFYQPSTPVDQSWAVTDNLLDGYINNWNQLTWTLHSGTAGVDAIWKVTPSYRWSQSSARMASGGHVCQYKTGDRTEIRQSLTKVASLGALTAPGQWFHDSGTNTLYVRPLDNLDLGGVYSDHVGARCPNAVHDGIAIAKLDGTDIRLVCHSYSVDRINVGDSSDYFDQPRAHYMQSGHGVLFTSNMNDVDGRRDAFIAWLPT